MWLAVAAATYNKRFTLFLQLVYILGEEEKVFAFSGASQASDLYKWQQISAEWKMKEKRKTLRYFVLLFCGMLKTITVPICHVLALSPFFSTVWQAEWRKCKWRWIGKGIASGLSNSEADEKYI